MQLLPSDYLAAALELAKEAERDANGFLTPESRRAVMAAYGMVDGSILPPPRPGSQPPKLGGDGRLSMSKKSADDEDYELVEGWQAPARMPETPNSRRERAENDEMRLRSRLEGIELPRSQHKATRVPKIKRSPFAGRKSLPPPVGALFAGNRGDKSLSAGRVKSTDQNNARQGMIDALGEGDHTAIHALHDWHQDNPGHPQERDVARLRDYVDHGYEGEQEDWTKPDDFNAGRAKPGQWEHPLTPIYHETPEQRRAVRARSAHGHLTGRPVGHDDLVHAKVHDRHGNLHSTYTGRAMRRYNTGPFIPDHEPTRAVYSTRYRAGYAHASGDLSHHATHHLSQSPPAPKPA